MRMCNLIQPTGRKRRPGPDQDRARPPTRSWPEHVLAAHHLAAGTKGPLAARFAAVRVRVGDGAAFANNRHLPGEEVWLVGEWRIQRRAQILSQQFCRPRTSRRALAGAIKARWVCEQAHQQLKQELRPRPFRGRSWTGLHRHALMTCIAFAYLQHLRLAEPVG